MEEYENDLKEIMLKNLLYIKRNINHLKNIKFIS